MKKFMNGTSIVDPATVKDYKSFVFTQQFAIVENKENFAIYL